MTKVLLLQGPDGNRYKATEIYNDIWTVAPFLNFTETYESAIREVIHDAF